MAPLSYERQESARLAPVRSVLSAKSRTDSATAVGPVSGISRWKTQQTCINAVLFIRLFYLPEYAKLVTLSSLHYLPW